MIQDIANAAPPSDDGDVEKLQKTEGGSEPVTDQMIEAGLGVLRTSGISDDYLEADKLLVADIYLAMRAAASSASGS